MQARPIAAAALLAMLLPGSGAVAQTSFPAATFFGAGDAIGAGAFRQALDCHGQKRRLIERGGEAIFVDDFAFPGTGAASSQPFDCAARTIQPSLRGWYSIAGAAGVAAFGTNNPSGLAPYPAGFSDPDIPFADMHYGLSSSPAALPNYDAGRWGRPIQIPLFVTPIAIAYDPVYARQRTASGVAEFTFNLKPSFARADGSGGLRLSRVAYCAIFNPSGGNPITNWNDARLRTLNGGQSLQDPDEAALGIAFDVPIRLVGRSDASPATELWTRHLAAACAAANAYPDATATLPAVTRSGATFEKGATPQIDGGEEPRRYLLADGADGVAQAIDYNPAPATIGQRRLNGKIGYLENDSVLPYVSHTGLNPWLLATASLGQGTGFLAPTPQNAAKAMVEIRPPQSTAAGVYDGAVTAQGDRADADAWVQPDSKTAPLATPAKGYPIVGTTNVLLYTCYADPNVRRGLAQLVGLFMGKVTKDSTNAAVPATLLTDPAIGLLGRNGFAGLPAAWKAAINETFLVKSVQPGPPAQAQPLRIVGTGSKMAVNAPVMSGDDRMFRQRTPHLIAGDLAEIRIGLMHWFHNGTRETALPNDVTYRAVWIERETTHEVVPVTFGGQRAVTLAANSSASHLLSDVIPASRWSSQPRRGELFWVHMVGAVPDLPNQQILDGMHASYAGAAHKRYSFAADAGLGIDYAGPVPTIPGANGSYDFGVPILFLGRFAICCSRSVAAVGDSITKGDGDTARATLIAGIGYGGRASVDAAGGNSLAVLVLARTGESAADFLASGARRIDLMRYADIAHVAYGTNDIGIGPGGGATMIGDRLRSIRQLIHAGAPNIQAITENLLQPRTLSTDAFATVAGQTPVSSDWMAGGARDRLNDIIRADAARPVGDPNRIDAAFDMLVPVQAAGDSTRWKADGNPRTWAWDGVHPASFAYARMADVARAGWLAVPLANGQPGGGTLGARNLWLQSKAGMPGAANPLCQGLQGAGESAP